MAFDIKQLMIGKCRQELPRLHLLPEIDIQLLNLVRKPFDFVTGRMKRHGLNFILFLCVINDGRCHDVDGGDKSPFGNTLDLFWIQAACEQVLVIRLNKSLLTTELTVEFDQP